MQRLKQMRKHTGKICLILVFVFMIGFNVSNISASQTAYKNPVLDISNADPFVLQHEGVYYLYGTNVLGGFKVFFSTDLVNWTEHNKKALSAVKNGGSGAFFWAPDVIHKDGMFYIFYTADERMYISKSESPLGPFSSHSDKPFLNRWSIDSHYFKDDDGQEYLFYNDGVDRIAVAKLTPDLKGIYQITQAIGTHSHKEPWITGHATEASYVIKRNGIYYLFFTANDWQMPTYAVGYATSTSPMGPWVKSPHNPILWKTDQIHGPGHNSFAYSPDGTELFMVYHIHESPGKHEHRYTSIDRVEFVPQPGAPDKVVVHGPTHTPQPLPSGSAEIQRIESAEMAVTAYEEAPLKTLVEIEVAELLEVEAKAKATLVQDSTAKAAFLTRITAKQVEVAIAKEELEPGDILYGDVNSDGQVTNVDLILLKRYIAGITVEDFNQQAADVDRNGKITNVDIIMLQRYLAGY